MCDITTHNKNDEMKDWNNQLSTYVLCNVGSKTIQAASALLLQEVNKPVRLSNTRMCKSYTNFVIKLALFYRFSGYLWRKTIKPGLSTYSG